MSTPGGAPAGALRLLNARLPRALLLDAPAGAGGALVTADLVIAGGAIRAIDLGGAPGNRPSPGPAGAPSGEGEGEGEEKVIDCEGGLVLPAFVDLHTHLDKGHIWPRRANPDGSFMGALDAVRGDRERHWSAADVERRMDFSLRCAFAHGTAAVRTHLDSTPPQDAISWPVFEAMRERWAGRIELQAVALVGPDEMLDPATLGRVAARAKAAGGVLGGAIASHPDARAAIRATVALAAEHGLDLDLHLDETGDAGSACLALLAEAVLDMGFAGRAVAGHCCSLAVQDRATAAATIARVAEAGIAVVSLPMCNMYLQGRETLNGAVRTPRWRGVTLLNELKAAGVAVAIASDNTRDPFYAYGDLDALEVLREAARIAHLDHPQDAAFDWTRAVTGEAARIGGFRHHGLLGEGLPADLVVLRARDWTEFLARPQSDRIVLRGGAAIDTRPPDYRELDDLMG